MWVFILLCLFCFLDSTYVGTWRFYGICLFSVWLTFLSLIPSRSVHITIYVTFFFHGWVTFYCDNLYVYIHILHLLYSSVSGYLGSFISQLLWIMLLLTMVSYTFLNLYFCFLWVNNHKWNFWIMLFSIMAAPIYNTTSSAWGFPILLIFANNCYLSSFWW